MTPATAARLGAVAVGAWLMAAPAVLGYDAPAADVDRILGPVAASLAFVAIWPFVLSLRWATMAVGALLVLAPVIGYPVDAAVSSVSSGVVIAALALVRRGAEGAFGGGWTVLWRGRRREAAPR